MKTILISLIVVALCGFNTREVDECLQLDIMMIADFSGSLQGKERIMVNGIRQFSRKFTLTNDGVRIGLISFSDAAILRTTYTGDSTVLNNYIDNLEYVQADGSTHVGLALEMTMDQIVRYGRQDVKKIVVIVTDGIPNDKEKALQMGELLKMNNVVIGGVMVIGMYGYDEHFLRNLTTKDFYYETDFANLVTTLKNMNICL